MKKIFLIGVALIASLSLMAEAIPAGYYDAANGKKDAELKTALSQIIYPVDWSQMTGTNDINVQFNAKNRYKYSGRTPNIMNDNLYTWDGFLWTDTREDGSVWDMYSPYIYYMVPDEYGAVSIPDQEIEHCFPKSWWGGTDNDAYKDLHHLNPANGKANNNKSNYPPGHVTTGDKIDNGVFRMDSETKSQYDWACYEPCLEYRGDFARAYFYIVTAYENFTWATTGSPYNAANALDNSSYLEFKPWLIQVLLDWHRADPVSEKEINRNNRVSDIQHNRNPFIDYPDLVEYIWGDKAGQAVDLSSLTFTGDESYELPIETMVSRALPATIITQEGFTANWKDAGKASYNLDVFTSKTTGSNDTILSFPIFRKGFVEADNRCAFSGTGTYQQGTGTTSVTFKPGCIFTISSLNIGANSKIVVRAMAPLKPAAVTDGAQMKISANGSQVALATLTHDEEYYTASLPSGTTTITIETGNSKYINIQQLFIITGNETTTHTSLEGFPKEVTGTSFDVEHAMENGKTLYYTITPAGLRTSAPIAVTYDPQDISITEIPQSVARKELRNGQIVILRNASIYSILGQTIR